jgi:CheY-like chemotaxis protein
VLVIHDDGDTLDLLTRLFEASGFDVVTAVSGFRAQAHLEGDRPIDVVVAPWDTTNTMGGDVYRWALMRRYDLRDRFVFVASDVPSDFDRIVQGRCLAVSMARPAEIVRVAVAGVRRNQAFDFETSRPDHHGRPTLLLADADPTLLMIMADVLTSAGYAVTRVESGYEAIERLEHEDFDALLIDWTIDGGTGAEVYRWLVENKPPLVERLVFLSYVEPDDASTIAPGRPVFRKGQDSAGLIDLLAKIVRAPGMT